MSKPEKVEAPAFVVLVAVLLFIAGLVYTMGAGSWLALAKGMALLAVSLVIFDAVATT